MVSERDIIIGNATTILMFVFSTIGGGAIINWLGGESQAVIIIGACLGLAYAILNAYFPNYLNWLGNAIPKKQTGNCVEEVEEELVVEEPLEESDDVIGEEDGGC